MFKGKRNERNEAPTNSVKLGYTQVTVKSVTKSSVIIELVKVNGNVKSIIKISNNQAKNLMDALDAVRIWNDVRKDINIIAAKAKVSLETGVLFHESSKAKIAVVGLDGNCILAIVDEYGYSYYSEAFPVNNYLYAFRDIRDIVKDMQFELI